jgi:hypothetical protein
MRNGKSVGISISSLVLILLIGASAWCEQSRPLKSGEKLSYEKEYNKGKMLTVLRIYYDNSSGRELVREYQGMECNAPQLSQDGKLIFFVLNLRDDKYDPDCLFVYDGRTGIDRKLFRATCQYSITPDARYVCFERRGQRKIFSWPNGKGENALSIPIVLLIDLSTMQEKSFDFAGTFLRGQWGSGVYINYDATANGFRVRFFMESRTFSQGTISLQDRQYHEDKR